MERKKAGRKWQACARPASIDITKEAKPGVISTFVNYVKSVLLAIKEVPQPAEPRQLLPEENLAIYADRALRNIPTSSPFITSR